MVWAGPGGLGFRENEHRGPPFFKCISALGPSSGPAPWPDLLRCLEANGPHELTPGPLHCHPRLRAFFLQLAPLVLGVSAQIPPPWRAGPLGDLAPLPPGTLSLNVCSMFSSASFPGWQRQGWEPRACRGVGPRQRGDIPAPRLGWPPEGNEQRRGMGASPALAKVDSGPQGREGPVGGQTDTQKVRGLYWGLKM